MGTTPAPADRQRAEHPRHPAPTEAECGVFLAALSRHASRSASALEACPRYVTAARAIRPFNRLAATDPAFALQIEEAIEAANDRIRDELFRRAVTGVKKLLIRGAQPIVNPLAGRDDPDHGFLHETEYSDSLLALLARKLPELVEKKSHDVNVTVTHKPGSSLLVTLDEIQNLDMADRKILGDLLRKLKGRKPLGSALESARASLPAPSERPVTDAEFSETVDDPFSMSELAEIL